MFPSPNTQFAPTGGYIAPPENPKSEPKPRPFPWRLVVLVALVSVLITAGIAAGVTVPLLNAKAASCSESNATATASPTSSGGSAPSLTLPVDIRVNQPLTGGTVRYNVEALQDMTRLVAYTNPASPANSTSFIFAVQRGLNTDERKFFGGSCADYEERTGCQVDYGGFKLAVGNITAPVTYAPFPIEKTNGLQIHYGGLAYRVSPCQPGFTTLLIQCDKLITGVPPNINYIEPVPCSFVVSMSHAAGCTL
ncbi:hypothetical protein BJ742DRAFT_562180 [Cladochytrium replicatum]|nr:hypothetical protein BJ742DRAFT_562180 [Cladochytrium replicatum]